MKLTIKRYKDKPISNTKKVYIFIVLVLFSIKVFAGGGGGINGTAGCLTADFRGINIKDALQIYADHESKNVVIDSQIEGTVDLTLKCVSSEVIKQSIMSLFDITITEKEGVLLASVRDRLTRNTHTKKIIKLFHVDSATVIQIFSDDQEHMTIAEIQSSNSVFLQGDKVDVQRLTESIMLIDVPKNQYMIAVEMIATTTDFSKKFGMLMQASVQNDNTSLDLISNFAAVGTSGASIVFNEMASALVRLEIAADELEGNSKLVSSPKILAYENQESNINQGVLIPYQVRQEDGAFTTEFQEASLSIRVTPRPAGDGQVYLDIFVTKDAPSLQTSAGILIETRQVSTHVRLKEGNTLVLGGIYENTETDSTSGVPYLKDLPYIGSMFGTNEQKTTTTEMLLLITPTLIIS